MGLFQAQRRKAETLLLAWLSASLRHVRLGSLADMERASADVRITPKSGHAQHRRKCLLSAKSGRYVGRRICIAGTKAIKAMLPAMAKAAP